MQEHLQFYINGEWVDPTSPATLDVINPTTEEAFARISMGSEADVNKAVAAATEAFESFSQTTIAERVEMFGAILGEYRPLLDALPKPVADKLRAENARALLPERGAVAED